MFYKSRIFQTIIAIISIVGYGYFAFAILTPGQTLDPINDNLCTGPNDPACAISFTSGALSIGDLIGNSPIDHAILYTDASGNLTQDAGFFRNLTTGETAFTTTGLLAGSSIYNGQTADGTFTLFGQDIPYEGNYNSVTSGDIVSYTINANADISAFDAQPAGTFFAQINENRWFDALGNTAASGVWKLPDVFGGNLDVFSELQTATGLTARNALNLDGAKLEWAVVISDNATFQNELYFSDINPLEWRFGTNTIWKMPTVQGTAGQTLVLDADNETLVWDTVSGGSGGDVLLDQSSNLYSTNAASFSGIGDSVILGNQAGPGISSTASRSIFLGNQAGSGVALGYDSIFIGKSAGMDASNVQNVNFLGTNAGFSATNATNSNFIGQNAGISATNASYSNFLGNNAGSNATNASNSIFIGRDVGTSDTVNNTITNTVDGCDFGTCWSVLIGHNLTTGGFSNSVLLGGDTNGIDSNTASNQFMLADSITNVRWRGVEYELPSAQGGAGEVLTNDGSGNLSWAAAGDGSGPFTIENGSSIFSTGLTDTGLNSTATNSFFVGNFAGYQATNANLSNFLGPSAGYGAIDANNSNFFGQAAGYGATNAHNSNFLGVNAGYQAVDVYYSNFLGVNAGYGAIDANNSNFFGASSGFQAVNASHSIFIGYAAGNSDSVDNTSANTTDGCNTITCWSILFGPNTGTGGFSNSIAVGGGAENTATNQFMLADSITNVRWRGVEYFLPSAQGGAGQVLTNDGSGVLSWAAVSGGSSPISIGTSGNTLYSSGLSGTGQGDTGVGNNIILGVNAGNGATNARVSNFIGFEAGKGATNVIGANFIGRFTGDGAINATVANFLGENAGKGATNAENSNFIGTSAGFSAANASYSNFLGPGAGSSATNASNSIFIGHEAGLNDTVNNTTALDDYSILLGNYTSTGGFENSIALGQRATNTATNQFMVGSTTRRIEEMVFNGGTGNTCSIVAGTGISCSSDERLKTNITDLSNTLDVLNNIRTVTYNWKEGVNQNTQIGFIAQNINEYFPELITTNHDGMLAVNYAGMTPILTKAIQELDIKLTSIETFASSVDTTFIESVKSWLGDVGNGIQKIIASVIEGNILRAKEQFCVGETCISEAEFIQLLESRSIAPVSSGDLSSSPDSGDAINPEESETLPSDGETALSSDGSVSPESPTQENPSQEPVSNEESPSNEAVVENQEPAPEPEFSNDSADTETASESTGSSE